MKKDVIYIDTEDDITSIIEKVKSAHEKIIALVPPKRAGVLQSAVNLKLLHKAAGSVDRRIVLITSDKALATLAAGMQIPVAKSLQSRPELAAVTDAPLETEDEVINGEELPVGELEKTAKPMPEPTDDDEIILPANLAGEKPKPAASAKKPKGKRPKIPNFSTFRKKLFLIIGGAALLIIFFIWAIFFAPHATVNIKAKTSSVEVNLPVSLNTAAATDPSKNVIKPLAQQVKKTNAVDFTATGKRDVGEKASGVVTIGNCASRNPIAIPAGTAVSSDGLNFFTSSSVMVPGGGSSGDFGPCNRPGVTNVSVAAQDVGEQYNLKKGSVFTVAGQNSSVSAANQNDFGGGSKRQITIISSGDVSAAQAKITSQDQNPVRQELTAKFKPKDEIIVNESFSASPGSPAVTPAVGTEAGSGRLTLETTYTLFAIDKDDARKTLEAFLNTKIKDQKDQRVYESGLDKLKLAKYAPAEGGGALEFITIGHTGPTIDAEKLKPQLVGKNYEEIRQRIQTVEGVDDVDTKFSPFWVSSAPDEKKIEIKFSVSKK